MGKAMRMDDSLYPMNKINNQNSKEKLKDGKPKVKVFTLHIVALKIIKMQRKDNLIFGTHLKSYLKLKEKYIGFYNLKTKNPISLILSKQFTNSRHI